RNRAFKTIPNLLAFSGQRPALAQPGCMVVVNTRNWSPSDCFTLLNCHRVVYPLSFGLAGDWNDWTCQDWCDQCHRKGGLVIADHLATVEEWGTLPGEALADLVLGKIDAIDIRAPAP